ncbi:hypothetical protein V6L77_06515 [Pannonibacter sp. Pt2-lr]
MRERLIGIDAGGTMTKAAMFDLDGNEIACRSSPNRMQFPAGLDRTGPRCHVAGRLQCHS